MKELHYPAMLLLPPNLRAIGGPEEPGYVSEHVYERDRDRIIHSKTFRRLKHKTQVFINPDGDHFITRMTHTLYM